MDNLNKKEAGSLFHITILLLLIPFVFLLNNVLSYTLSHFIGISNSLVFFGLIGFFQAIIIIFFTALLARGLWQMDLKGLGLGLEGLKQGFRGGLKYGPVVFVLVVFGSVLVERIRPFDGEMQPFAQLVLEAATLPELLMLVFLGVFLAPLAEEMYFRGLLFPVIKERLGVVGGIVCSGLIFGLMHLDLQRFLPLALGGMALAYLYHRTNSLYAAITAHGVWNGIMFLILYLFQNPSTF